MSAAINTTTNTTSDRTSQTLRVLAASVMAIAAILLLSVSPAAAIEGPGDLLPGGNGPVEPEPPIDIVPGFEIIPLAPTATIDVSCAAETATVTLGNKTNNFHSISVEVDGQLHDATAMSPDTQWMTTFSLAENDNALVQVLNGSKTLLAEDVRRDCLLPEPGYVVHSDCGLGKAHVRLSNTGDDMANMAVQYADNPYALEQVGPGGHLDWELVVGPNETVDFTVRFGHDALGTESFTFTCEVPEILPPEVGEGGDGETEDGGEDETEEETEDETEDETEEGGDEGPIVVEPKPEPGVDPVVDPEVEGETEVADEDPAASDVDELDDAAIDPETGLLETGLDDDSTQEVDDTQDNEDEDDDAVLAFAGSGSTGDSGGSSIGRIVVIVLWTLVASLAIAAALLAWSRREDNTEALIKA